MLLAWRAQPRPVPPGWLQGRPARLNFRLEGSASGRQFNRL